jgi:hypothetical protein
MLSLSSVTRAAIYTTFTSKSFSSRTHRASKESMTAGSIAFLAAASLILFKIFVSA